MQVTPPQLAPYIDMKRWLPAAVWERLEEELVEATLGCCQVTGLKSLPMFPDEVCHPSHVQGLHGGAAHRTWSLSA